MAWANTDSMTLRDQGIQCWNCHSAVRAMVFLPNDSGSYLGIKCSACQMAQTVLNKLEQERIA